MVKIRCPICRNNGSKNYPFGKCSKPRIFLNHKKECTIIRGNKITRRRKR